MVSAVVLLDAGPLGLVTNPKRGGKSADCARWLQSLVSAGVRVLIPEIADYEIRRELLRANKAAGIAKLNALEGAVEYLPINTVAMQQAAQLWAHARQQGQPTASDESIDADMILIGQGSRTLHLGCALD
jgi:predicted nucleic acid-binding protein